MDVWLQKVADWVWFLIVSAVIGASALVRRVWKHESRITALEAGANERTQQLTAINTKLDRQTETLMNRIDSNAKETREDIRLLTTELLKKVP